MAFSLVHRSAVMLALYSVNKPQSQCKPHFPEDPLFRVKQSDLISCDDVATIELRETVHDLLGADLLGHLGSCIRCGYSFGRV